MPCWQNPPFCLLAHKNDEVITHGHAHICIRTHINIFRHTLTFIHILIVTQTYTILIHKLNVHCFIFKLVRVCLYMLSAVSYFKRLYNKDISDFRSRGLINYNISVCDTAFRSVIMNTDILTWKYVDTVLLSEKIKLQH